MFETLYSNNRDGKRKIVEEIIDPLVRNEGKFVGATYVEAASGEEYIVLNSVSYEKLPPKFICVTADSVEALCRDFVRKYAKIIDEK